MAWVRFTDDHDHHPTDRSTIAYKAGMHVSVTRRCADEVKRLGKGVETKAPKREDPDGSSDA